MVPEPIMIFKLDSLDLVSAEVVVVMEVGPGLCPRCTTFWRHCMMRNFVSTNFWACKNLVGLIYYHKKIRWNLSAPPDNILLALPRLGEPWWVVH